MAGWGSFQTGQVKDKERLGQEEKEIEEGLSIIGYG